MRKPEKELRSRDATRDLGQELLQAVRDLSQARFARLLGVSVRTLQDWEQARREPSGAAKTLILIATRRPDVLRSLLAA